MQQLTLNIYGENDEIIKTFSTSHLRWKIFTQALALDESIKGRDLKTQLDAINGFVLSVFPGLTTEDLENADGGDVFNVFKMIVNMARNINGGEPEKNA